MENKPFAVSASAAPSALGPQPLIHTRNPASGGSRFGNDEETAVTAPSQ